jgi:hypothetical protein
MQFAAVAQQLVVKDGIIDAEEVTGLVGAGPLAAMVRDNLLSERLVSPLAPHVSRQFWHAQSPSPAQLMAICCISLSFLVAPE